MENSLHSSENECEIGSFPFNTIKFNLEGKYMKERFEITQQLLKLLIQIGIGIGFVFYVSYYISIGYFPDISASELTNVLLIIAAIGMVFITYFFILLLISGVMLRDLKKSNAAFALFITNGSNSFWIFIPTAIIMLGTFLLTHYCFQSEIFLIIGIFVSSLPLIVILRKKGELSLFESIAIGLFYTLSNFMLPVIFAVHAQSMGDWAIFSLIAVILFYTAIVNSAIVHFQLDTSSNKFGYWIALAIIPSAIVVSSAFFNYGKQFVSIPFSIAKYGRYEAIPIVIDSNYTAQIGFKNDTNASCFVKNSLGKEYYFSCDNNKTEWIIPKDKIMMKLVKRNNDSALFFE